METKTFKTYRKVNVCNENGEKTIRCATTTTKITIIYLNNNLQVGHGSVDDVPSLVEVAADRFDTPDISTIQPPAAHYIIISIPPTSIHHITVSKYTSIWTYLTYIGDV